MRSGHPSRWSLVLWLSAVACGAPPPDDAPLESGALHTGLPAAQIPEEVLGALESGRPVEVLVALDEPRQETAARLGRADRRAALELQAELRAELTREFLGRLPDGVRPTRTYRHVPLVAVRLADPEAALALAERPEVLAIHPEIAVEPSLTQSLSLIGQPTAVARGHLGAGTAVAVLDTGADWTHADLGSCTAVGAGAGCRVVHAEDFAPDDGQLDSSGHGTNVSSIVARVAPAADIIALDVFRSDGYGYSSDIIAAIDWAIDNQEVYDIAAINMSLGGGAYTSPCADAFGTAIDQARQAGIAVAVASGNSAYTNAMSTPACNPGAVSVGAVYDSDLGPVGWSGCTDATTAADKVTCFSNSASFLDILAPGALIGAGGYLMGGTSQAAPHIAGALAILRGVDPDASVERIEDRLLETGDPVLDSRNGRTFPRLDLGAATQDCGIRLSVGGLSPSSDGDSGVIEVDADPSCVWTVSSDADWLTLDAGGGVGDASIGWAAEPNDDDERTATLTWSGFPGASLSALQRAPGGDPLPTGTVTIDGGAAFAASSDVALAFTASAGVASLCVSNTETCSSWIGYASSLPWTLPAGTGSRTVRAWFRDGQGRTSLVASDTIGVDLTPPTNGSLSAVTGDGQATLSWFSFADVGSGVASYRLVQASGSAAPASCSGSPVWSGTGSSVTLTGLTNGSTYAWRLCAVDHVGNVSSGAVATLTVAPETVPPVGTIVVDGGAAWTNGRSVTVSLSATDASGVAQACLSNNGTCTTWFPMAASAPWTLAAGVGTKTVRGWFKDVYGNVSAATTDAIGVDTSKPAGGAVTLTGGAGSIGVSWSGFTDKGSGISAYKVVYGSVAPAAACATGAVAHLGPGSGTTITGLTNGATTHVRVCAIDQAGNVSGGVAGSARAAPEFDPPTGTVTANGGDDWTKSRTLSLAIAASDASGVSRMCVSKTASCTAWAAFAPTASLNVATGDGPKTVRVWLEDIYGNVSPSPLVDTIGLDATAPTNGAVSASGAAGGASVSWSGFADPTSGIASYTLVWAPRSAPINCSRGTVGYTGPNASATLGGLVSGTTYHLRVCATDRAGNRSSGAVTSVTAL